MTILGHLAMHRWLMIASIGAFVILGVVLSVIRPAMFESSATLVLQDPGTVGFLTTVEDVGPDRFVADQAAILRSDSVAEKAISILETDFDDPPSLNTFRDSSAITSDPASNVIQVAYTADDPQLSQAGANALIAAYRESVRTEATQNYDETLATINSTILEIDNQVAELESEIDETSTQPPAEIDLEYQNALERLVALQQSRPNLEPEELEGFRAELIDLLTFLEAYRVTKTLDDESQELLSLLAELDTVLERRDELLSLREDIAFDRKFAGRSSIIFSAAGPGEEVSGGAVQILVIAVVLGALFGFGLLLVLPAVKPKIETPEGAAEVLETTVLADIPDFASLTEPFQALATPGSVAADRFARVSSLLQTRLDIVRNGLGETLPANVGPLERDDKGRFKKPPRVQGAYGSGRSVAVVSAGPSEGRTALIANLAAAAATQSNRILAVDAHFEKQDLTKMLEGSVSARPGLTDIVQRGVALSDAVRTVDLESGARLNLVSRGSQYAAPLDLFRSARGKEFFRDAADQFDLVFVDTPPLYVAPYAAALARYCEEVAVVVPHGSPLSEIVALGDQLRIVSANLLGVIYNRHLPGTPVD